EVDAIARGEAGVVGWISAPPLGPRHQRDVVPRGWTETDRIPVEDDGRLVAHPEVRGVEVAMAHHEFLAARDLAPALELPHGVSQRVDVVAAHDADVCGDLEVRF